MVAVTSPRHILAPINYFLEPENGEAFEWWPARVAEKRRKHDERTVKITDVRGSEQDFNLDQQGFHFSKLPSCEQDYGRDEQWVPAYYEQCENFLKQITGATRTKAVSHIVRNNDYDETKRLEKDLDDTAPRTGNTSARFAHVDQSEHGAEIVVNAKLDPEERERLTKTRWAIVNLWRPFGRPVTREALAVCDAGTVEKQDLYAATGHFDTKALEGVKISSGKSTVQSYLVKGNPKHEWYYRSLMQPDEVLLIKQFDSKQSGVARATPHCAFKGPDDFGRARQSIETRVILFFEDQTSE